MRFAKERTQPSDEQVVTGPSFRFRLERVRAVRERRETLAKQDLARAIARLSVTQDELLAAEERLERARTHARAASTPAMTVDAAELQARQAFIERIEAVRCARSSELAQREDDVAIRGAELTVAAGEHEMMNRLRERQRREHDREASRREGIALDEMATVRFGRSVA
jgi:flagellar export protein FliJ